MPKVTAIKPPAFNKNPDEHRRQIRDYLARVGDRVNECLPLDGSEQMEGALPPIGYADNTELPVSGTFEGEIVYVKDINQHKFWDGNSWVALAGGNLVLQGTWDPSVNGGLTDPAGADLWDGDLRTVGHYFVSTAVSQYDTTTATGVTGQGESWAVGDWAVKTDNAGKYTKFTVGDAVQALEGDNTVQTSVPIPKLLGLNGITTVGKTASIDIDGAAFPTAVANVGGGAGQFYKDTVAQQLNLRTLINFDARHPPQTIGDNVVLNTQINLDGPLLRSNNCPALYDAATYNMKDSPGGVIVAGNWGAKLTNPANGVIDDLPAEAGRAGVVVESLLAETTHTLTTSPIYNTISRKFTVWTTTDSVFDIIVNGYRIHPGRYVEFVLLPLNEWRPISDFRFDALETPATVLATSTVTTEGELELFGDGLTWQPIPMTSGAGDPFGIYDEVNHWFAFDGSGGVSYPRMKGFRVLAQGAMINDSSNAFRLGYIGMGTDLLDPPDIPFLSIIGGGLMPDQRLLLPGFTGIATPFIPVPDNTVKLQPRFFGDTDISILGDDSTWFSVEVYG